MEPGSILVSVHVTIWRTLNDVEQGRSRRGKKKKGVGVNKKKGKGNGIGSRGGEMVRVRLE